MDLSADLAEGSDLSLRSLTVRDGTCYLYLVFEVGLTIDLELSERRIKDTITRPQLCKERRQPRYFGYRPRPIRIVQEGSAHHVGEYRTLPSAELTLWDFGAISVAYKIKLGDGTLFSDLVALSAMLYENTDLEAAARARVSSLITTLGPAVARPTIASTVEDYVVFEIERLSEFLSGDDLCERQGRTIAQILRADTADLSADTIADALSYRCSFTPADLTIIDWNAAFVYGRDNEDTQAVLEFSQVQLLEMRFLDEKLDRHLDDAYRASMRSPGLFEADISRVGRLSIDAAVLFEAVTNSLKLMGEQFLAQVHDLASQRFRFHELDVSIVRKLQTLDAIYEKLADRRAVRRSEILEIVVIVLIALELLRGVLF